MGDLKIPALMYLKALLFVAIGVSALVIIWLETRNLKVVGVALLGIWAFARAYYFCFYVIEKYIDKDYKFAGLFSVVQYLLKRRQ